MNSPSAKFSSSAPSSSSSAGLRGDPIGGDRYCSTDFMALEWRHMWPRTWHIGCSEHEIPKPGDFMTVELGPESILIVRQKAGAIRAFYNVCPHRGNRLVSDATGHKPLFTCSYHSWSFRQDGTLAAAPDSEDFPQGNPCGAIALREIRTECWGGFVWYNMEMDATDLRSYLGPEILEHLGGYEPGKMLCVERHVIELECNWKVMKDNFNESYHTRTLHPLLKSDTLDHYKDTEFLEFPSSGHSLMKMKSHLPLSGDPNSPLAATFREWDLDLNQFTGSPQSARTALQRQKRELGYGRGYRFFEALSDEQLTDYYHFNIFPTASITMRGERGIVLRPRPHPRDPQKCFLDYWDLVAVLPGQTVTHTIRGVEVPCKPAVAERFRYGEKPSVVDEDLVIVVKQQQGLASRSFQDAYLAAQESRVRRHHEVLNDYIEGRR